MNEQLYQDWIDALESGDYEPGKLYLRRDDDNSSMYCCLGVLCELSELGTWRGEDKVKGYSVDDEETHALLPTKLMQEMGFNTMEGDFNINDLSYRLRYDILHHVQFAFTEDYDIDSISLVEINDGFILRSDSDIKSPFTLIAAILNEMPESLFKYE